MNANIIVAGKNMLTNEALKLALSKKGYNVHIEEKNLSILRDQIQLNNIDVIIWDEAILREKHEAIITLTKSLAGQPQSIFLISSKTFFLVGVGLTNGISGFVHKEGSITELDECIKNVLNDTVYLSPTLTGSNKPNLTNTLDKIEKKLTATEKKVMHFVKQSKTSKEIAAIQNVSIRTIEKHRHNICKKLGLRGAYSLYDFANRYYKMVDPKLRT